MSSSERASSGVAAPERCGASLLNDSYAQVAEVFEEWLPSKDSRGRILRERGGVRRAEKARRAAPRVPDYHVESTFDPKQRLYVGIATAALNMLAKGRLLARDGDVTPLADRITGTFLAQQPHNAHFGDSVAKGIFGVLDDFGSHFPNLTPALMAMSSVGGIEGLKLAHSAARGELGRIIAKTSFMTPVRYVHSSASTQQFVGTHPRIAPPPRQYEVWCPSESFAKSLIRQSQQAAETLEAQEPVRATYNPQLTGLYDEPRLEPALRQKITAVYEAAGSSATVQPLPIQPEGTGILAA